VRSEPDGWTSLSVADNGIGIAEADIPRVLTPFSQADNAYVRKQEGTGLGLPLVKSFAELHDGTFAITSALGVGTTVTVRFRRVLANESASNEGRRPSPPSLDGTLFAGDDIAARPSRPPLAVDQGQRGMARRPEVARQSQNAPGKERSVPVPSGGIPRYRQFNGPALFQAGFRPFFLGAGLWAPMSLALWLLFLFGHNAAPNQADPLLWHMHEMLFGFGVAAAAGFLLTAIPNWTGRLPLQGWSLMLLWLLWAAGRVIGTIPSLSESIVGSAIDLSFLATLRQRLHAKLSPPQLAEPADGSGHRTAPTANALMQAQAAPRKRRSSACASAWPCC
jgi:hypothetical protein